MNQKKPIILDSKKVGLEKVDKGKGVFIQRLIVDEQGSENCFMRKFTIKPGGSMPDHRHENTDHVQYILEGKMEVNLEGDEHTVEKGDSLYIPTGTKHSYKNPFDEEVKFICVVPAVEIKTEIME